MLEELLRRSLELEQFGCEKAALTQAIESYRIWPVEVRRLIALRVAA
jgi:hypothetical protein